MAPHFEAVLKPLSLMTFVATLLSSGTTATVALLRDGIELVVASVGDSRALLCRKGKVMKLTIDHTPERKEEKERYLLAGEMASQSTASVRMGLCSAAGLGQEEGRVEYRAVRPP